MASILLEIRQVARGLARSAGYSTSVLLTLALGIGAVTAVFALIDGVLLAPLPYPESGRLVLLRQQNPQDEWNTSAVDFLAVRARSESFEGVAASRSMDVILTGGSQPEWVDARRVTADYFDVMGIAPALGRGFRPGEDRPGAPPAVVIGDAFAARHFGDADPLGKTLVLDGVAHTVVGVMPPGADRLPGMRADLWPAMQIEAPLRRGPFLFNTFARLEPGVTREQADAELAAISRQIFPLWQAGFQDETARLAAKPLHEAVVGDSGRFLWIAFAAVGAVLLIAVVNVANLVLMRATERMHDLAVRAALGASRRRLARLLTLESLLLASAGGLAGAGFAAVLLELYRALGPGLPRLAEVAIDGRVAALTGGLVAAIGVLFGLLPLFFTGTARASRRSQAGAASGGASLLRSGLVTLQFALALPLLVAAGLLIESFASLQRVDPGFEADHLLTARVRLPDAGYPDALARVAFWERALAELRSLPGVAATGLAAGIPPDAPASANNFEIVGRPSPEGRQPMSPWTPVTDGFFATLGVDVLEGRGFDSRDRPDTEPVVLVSSAWAKRFFPGESAVGRQLYEGGDFEAPVTIVGVTGDVKFSGLDQPGESVYAPITQGWANNPAYVYLRTRTDPVALAGPLTAVLRRLDPAAVPTEVTTMRSRLRDSLGDERHWAVVIAAFACLAVLLSAVGVAGVLAYYVSRQHREIGIRVALGADARRVLGMVLGRGLACALAGGAAGLVLASFLTRGLEALLYDVGRTDLPTMIAAFLVLLAIALAASWLPARRAARVDAATALRAD